MKTAAQTYAPNINQVADLVAAIGNQRTVLVEGHMGTGKTTLLKILSEMEQFKNHVPVYFDATTKDMGDLFIPKFSDLDGKDHVTFVPNEELGVHIGKPVILMIDEFGKANPMVQQALLRVLLERMAGSRPLPDGSVVFATTNLGAEGVNDLIQAHGRNRLTVVQMRKPTHMEWLEWGINNGIDHTLLGWVKDTPQLFQTFDEVSEPDENPYIYHPQSTRAAFVTPRSLEAASDILKQRKLFDRSTLTAALIGTVGDVAAMDMMAFVSMADEIPSVQDIKDNPDTAVVPRSAAAVCMVVYRTLSIIDNTWVDAWMRYLNRLDNEAQGLFVNGVRSDKYNKQRQSAVMSNGEFTNWARAKQYLFTADK